MVAKLASVQVCAWALCVCRVWVAVFAIVLLVLAYVCSCALLGHSVTLNGEVVGLLTHAHAHVCTHTHCHCLCRRSCGLSAQSFTR